MCFVPRQRVMTHNSWQEVKEWWFWINHKETKEAYHIEMKICFLWYQLTLPLRRHSSRNTEFRSAGRRDRGKSFDILKDLITIMSSLRGLTNSVWKGAVKYSREVGHEFRRYGGKERVMVNACALKTTSWDYSVKIWARAHISRNSSQIQGCLLTTAFLHTWKVEPSICRRIRLCILYTSHCGFTTAPRSRQTSSPFN